MKICKAIVLVVLSMLSVGVILLFEINAWPVGSSLAGIALGFSLPGLVNSIQDLLDTTNWKTSQRKLKRGRFIEDSTIIRISFAYLYRIKIGNKYLLVKNERGTGKYQPVGGVYKLLGKEKMELRNRYKSKMIIRYHSIDPHVMIIVSDWRIDIFESLLNVLTAKRNENRFII